MSAQPTPGQWLLLRAGIETTAHEHEIVAGPHMATIATLPVACSASTYGEDGETEISREESLANARLFLAAPDLLKACAASMAGYPTWPKMMHDAYYKATGEKP